MIKFPYKKIYGLLGAPRSGKDAVVKYLQESRNFVAFAFADKIKEEYGISKEDFEMAKISGDIGQLRQKLWKFSAEKKSKDPNYFIRLVMEEAVNTEQSVVITDIRTEEEFGALFQQSPSKSIIRAYMVGESDASWESIDKASLNYVIKGSMITKDFYCHQKFALHRIMEINNKIKGLHLFYRELENFFFKEDMIDLLNNIDKIKNNYRESISGYISQFDVREKYNEE